ncbi:DUF58 domain-containing protein [Devosia naphthalenivorans]|uniref:DUF58 domain-containing protein n=1 Tax=Devosia naphthalenivorans TaxID=2082392 RepID=UPI000D3BDCD6|nr:DUF58 domain-containing protein [Devosia naphthalenivorans]
MRPDPALLERLAGSRFLPNLAKPSIGTGERRSSSHGVGLEFSAHRPYREGDDLRRLDPRIRARLGQDYVRQYAEDRQLPITIVLDSSASMLQGEGKKLALASALTQILAFVGLAAGDVVRIAVVAAGETMWSPKWQALSRADELFAWVSDQSSSGRVHFEAELASISTKIPPGSLLIVLSDWWADDIGRAVLALAEHNHQLLALHIESPDEIDPSDFGEGLHHLVDAETDELYELVLNELTLQEYKAAYAERSEQLRSQFLRWGGQYLRVSTDADLPDFCLRTLRASGVIS